MMFAEFIRHYSYTAEQALDEYAKRFFALVNSMYRVQAKEAIMALHVGSAGNTGGKDAQKVLDQLNKQAKGNQAILEEVRIIKNVN